MKLFSALGRLSLHTLLALLAGSMISAMFPGSRKVGRAFVHFATYPKWIAPAAASAHLSKCTEEEIAGFTEEGWREFAASQFGEDILRMRWKWNGELEWRENPALKPVSARP